MPRKLHKCHSFGFVWMPLWLTQWVVKSDHAQPFIYRTKSPKMSEVNSPKLMTGHAQKNYGCGFCSSCLCCPPSARIAPKGLSKKVSCCGQNGSSASQRLPLPLSSHGQPAKHPEDHCLRWVHMGSLAPLFPWHPHVIDVAVLAFRVAFDHLTSRIKWWIFCMVSIFFVLYSVASRKNQSTATPLLLEHNLQPWCSFRVSLRFLL